MLSAIIGEMFKHNPGKACVLAHRDELTFQNEDKFKRVNPDLSTSVFDASVKSWNGEVTFAMVQTLSRENNLSAMPPMDILVIDEAHHARADSYMRVIERVKQANAGVKIAGHDRHAQSRRQERLASGFFERLRPDHGQGIDRLRPPCAAAHLRHGRRRAGRTAPGEKDRQRFRHGCRVGDHEYAPHQRRRGQALA
jgi:hypothetical protein